MRNRLHLHPDEIENYTQTHLGGTVFTALVEWLFVKRVCTPWVSRLVLTLQIKTVLLAEHTGEPCFETYCYLIVLLWMVTLPLTVNITLISDTSMGFLNLWDTLITRVTNTGIVYIKHVLYILYVTETLQELMFFHSSCFLSCIFHIQVLITTPVPCVFLVVPAAVFTVFNPALPCFGCVVHPPPHSHGSCLPT